MAIFGKTRQPWLVFFRTREVVWAERNDAVPMVRNQNSQKIRIVKNWVFQRNSLWRKLVTIRSAERMDYDAAGAY